MFFKRGRFRASICRGREHSGTPQTQSCICCGMRDTALNPKLLVYVWKVCFQGDGWLEELGASMQRSEFSQRAFESHGTCSGMGNVVIMTDYGDLVCSNPTLSRV